MHDLIVGLLINRFEFERAAEENTKIPNRNTTGLPVAADHNHWNCHDTFSTVAYRRCVMQRGRL